MDRPIPDGNDTSHEVLGLVALCRDYQVLPQPGGLLDQDSFLVYVMMIYMRAQVERQELDQKKQEAQAAAARRRSK